MIEFVVLCMGRFFFSSNFILPKELDVGKIEIRKLFLQLMEQYCNKLVDCLSNFVKLQERLSRLVMIFKLKAQYNLEIGNIYIYIYIYIYMFFLFFLILNNKWATKIGTGLDNPNLGAGPASIIEILLLQSHVNT
jgi:hypothetical protein